MAAGRATGAGRGGEGRSTEHLLIVSEKKKNRRGWVNWSEKCKRKRGRAFAVAHRGYRLKSKNVCLRSEYPVSFTWAVSRLKRDDVPI